MEREITNCYNGSIATIGVVINFICIDMEDIQAYSVLAGAIVPVLISLLKSKVELDKKQLRALVAALSILASGVAFFSQGNFSIESLIVNCLAIIATAEVSYQWIIKYVEQTV